MNKITLLTIFIFSFQTIFTQNTRVVNGNISENSGIAIIGASVLVQSTGKGVATDLRGSFSIEIPSGEQQLQISSLGYYDAVVTVKPDQNHIDIILTDKVIDIDEIVVVGYGTQHKTEITNAISKIDFESLETVPQSNTMNLLAGRAPGLSVIQLSGEPGADDSEVKLRGIGTTGFSNPLIIIDGITSTMKDLSTLAPSEIANISLLKDAASTAIYGSRGAHGVMLVTTKEPEAGTMRVDINSQLSFQKATYLPRYVESWQWMTLQNAARKAGALYPQEKIDSVRNGFYDDAFSNDDLVSSLFRVAPQQMHTITISGGSKELSSRASFGYVDQEGIMYNTDSKRYNYRVSLNSEINKYMKFGVDFSGFDQTKHTGYENTSNIMRNLQRAHPITPLKYSNGDWGVYNSFDGIAVAPPRLLAEIGRWDTRTSRMNLRPFATFKPIKNLTLYSNFSYTTNIERRERFNPTYRFFTPEGLIGLENKVNTLTNTNIEFTQIQSTTTATYNFAVKRDHRFTILGGYEFLDYKRKTVEASGSNLPDNEHQVMYLATTDIKATSERRDWVFESVFGRLNYAFKNKYFIQVNTRMDGSSRLPLKNRYHLISSASAGWDVSKEKFFLKLPVSKQINNLKFRVAYGQAGNDPLGAHRTFQQTMESQNYYYFGEQLIPGTAVNLLSNPDLNWVVTTTGNFGIDIQMFKNTFSVSLDLYDKLTEGILYEVDLAPSFGYPERYPSNLTAALNKGFEIDVKYKNKVGKLEYNIGFNATYNINKVITSGGEVMFTGPFMMRGDQPFNAYYGYVYDGIIKDSTELNRSHSLTLNNLQIGSMKFKDLNGDGVIDDDDRKVIGTSNIPFESGISGGLYYKGFDMNFLIHIVLGKTIYLRDWGNRPTYSDLNTFWAEWWDNRYDPESNPNGTWPVIRQGSPGEDEVSTFWLHDASYLRLKNLEVGYSLPPKMLSKIFIKKVRFYVSGQNFLTFSKLIKQIDPEREARRTGNNIYPQVKLITAGVNINL